MRDRPGEDLSRRRWIPSSTPEDGRAAIEEMPYPEVRQVEKPVDPAKLFLHLLSASYPYSRPWHLGSGQSSWHISMLL